VIHEKRDAVMSAIVDAARAELWAAYRACADAPAGEAEGAASGRRALRSFVLQLLCRGADADPAALECALEQFRGSTNMTDQMGALRAVVLSCPAAVPDIANVRQQCLDAFYDQWKEYPLVVLKWLRLSAAQPGMDADGMARLMAREAFDLKNPNKVNATVFGFAGVPTQFHRRDASGYKVVADVIKRLDSLNATTAASLASVFTNWKRVAPAERREAMRAEMQSILEVKGLSADTYEILSKSLA